MKAWTISEPGSRANLIMIEKEKPLPEKGELLIKVKAAGANRTDT